MPLLRGRSDNKHLQPDGRLLCGRLTGVVDVIGSHNRLGLAPDLFTGHRLRCAKGVPGNGDACRSGLDRIVKMRMEIVVR